jgi:hypothetical protein
MKNWIFVSALALVFASCHKEGREYANPQERTINIADFKGINAGGSFTVDIDKGNSFSVKAKGRPADLDDLRYTVAQGNILNIEYDHYEPGRYRVDFTITLPLLTQITLSGNSKGDIYGFAGQSGVLRTVVSGNSELTLNGTAANMPIDLSGNAKLTVSGTTLSLYGSLSGNVSLYAYNVNATEVDISGSGNILAYVHPMQSFFADVSGQCRIYYKGDPTQTSFTTSGNAKIIKE